jgi:hypothetical protein
MDLTPIASITLEAMEKRKAIVTMMTRVATEKVAKLAMTRTLTTKI